MKTAIAFATLLLTATLAAQEAHVYPLAPTTATPIEVHYLSGCRSTHTIVREGTHIQITAHDVQCDGVANVEKVKLPELLPIGSYDVSIAGEHDPFYLASTSFVVRNGAPLPFELHPSTVDPFGNAPVHMRGVSCITADCSDITVRVGGEVVPVMVSNGSVFFTSPDHASGFADVTVQNGDSLVTSPGALYYRNGGTRGEIESRSLEEPILFPILVSANGGYGSRWRSEATISNPMPWTIDARYTLHQVGPCIGPCDPPFEPKSFERFEGGYPRGTIVWAPGSEASLLATSLRIRDLSHAEQGWGTDVPVVREHDFVHGKNIRLLDVPLDPRYRVKVRIYMIDPVLAPSLDGKLRIGFGDTFVHMPFTLTNRSHAFSIEPYYAEVDLPQVEAGQRVNVEVMLPVDAIAWAFASVTNNETQQVTIVAPY